MFNKILVATDGSEDSLAAASTANYYIENNLAKKVIVLNVKPTFVPDAIDIGFVITDNVKAWTDMAKEYGKSVIKETCGNIKNQDVVSKKVLIGDAASKICEYAEANDCDLIMMGNRGNGPLKGLLLGSVSAKVLKYAKCPVLIIKA